MTTLLFPSYPSAPDEPDAFFADEATAAREAGFNVGFVDVELNLGGSVHFRRLPETDTHVIYRGWILRPDDYDRMSEALDSRGLPLLESPRAYRETYEFPRWYARLRDETPRSLVIPKPCEGAHWDLGDVAEKVYETFQTRLSEKGQARRKEIQDSFSKAVAEGGMFSPNWTPEGQRLMLELPRPCPILVKDWIKSRKSEWFEACYIPDVRDRAHTMKVIEAFIRLTEMADLAGGLVFREFEEFERIGTHTKTRMPVINEWRCMMLHDRCFYRAPYWSDGDYQNVEAPPQSVIDRVAQAAGKLSAFWSLDLARKPDGTWRVIEVGSGGASGVPDGGDKAAFYRALREAVG